jgi:Spy/CpxP family protein refolding chaperone
MLGFVIGTVCAIGLIKAVRRGRRHRGFGWPGRGYGRAPGSRMRLGLRSLFESLRTTPGQEETILAAVDGLRGNGKLVREELKQTRSDLARAVRSGLVDDAAFEESFARHDRLLAQLRVSVVEVAKQAAEALDEQQRKLLADRIEGRSFFGGGGSWRGGPSVWA